MDEAIEKKIRALKLKIVMAERELQASSGKWRLGVLLKAGHANAMNREVDKVKERLESKIESIKAEIEALSSGAPAALKPAKPEKPVKAAEPKPVAKRTGPIPAPKKAAAKKPAAKSATKKSAVTKKPAGKK
jgi:hypothetical protein